MKNGISVIGLVSGALLLAALACTSPNAPSVDATAMAAQLTVVAGLTQANIQFPTTTEDTQVAVMLRQTADAMTALASHSTPVPPPATITLAAQPSPTATIPPTNTPQPTAIPATSTPATGAASGKLCYPASILPALTIFAKNVTSGAIFQQENPQDQINYTFPGLPAGTYYFFAYTHTGASNPTSIGIGYTQFVLCGLQASCTDHTMIAVTVTAGTTTPNIDICDGYQASAIPPKP